MRESPTESLTDNLSTIAGHERPTPAPTPAPNAHKLSPKKVWNCRRVFLLRRRGVPSVGWFWVHTPGCLSSGGQRFWV
uniref:Uncharacterized protein n=1 Tax=Phage sp. ctesc4 TaxID=2828008 RepID=A0A8S5TED3_9VIRU|nr:MAG TPA: hypothetical protein [Phage sp. ctesc4]